MRDSEKEDFYYGAVLCIVMMILMAFLLYVFSAPYYE